METKLLKTTQLLVFIYVIFFFAGCSKNTIILEVGDENKPSGGNNTEGTNLVTFNASIEGRNLMTRAMSPMNQGIKSKVLVFEPSTQNGTKGTPSAQGLYITSAPGVLTGVDGYKMYLGNGILTFMQYRIIFLLYRLHSRPENRNLYSMGSITFGGIIRIWMWQVHRSIYRLSICMQRHKWLLKYRKEKVFD